jgi:threonine dehydrogenase-like Zn-dependent dehydrogenase
MEATASNAGTRSSRQAVLFRANTPLEIVDAQVPAPGPGEIVVRVTLAGVCGSDIHLWRGDLEVPFAFVMGHEAVGTIEALGAGVIKDFAGRSVALGDRVYWCPTRPCHRCYACTVDQDLSSCEDPKAVISPADQPTFAGYATLAALPADMAFYRLEDDVPAEAVIALGCALPAVLQGIERLGGIEPTNDVIVQGAGPIGLSMVMCARLAGARRIVVVEPRAPRREMALRFGATAAVEVAPGEGVEERRERIQEILGRRGADVVCEATGSVPAFEEGIELLARNGRYLVIGTWAGQGTAPVSPFEVVDRNLRIVGTRYAQPRHYYRAMVLAGTYHREFPLVEAITHRFSLDQSQDALQAVTEGEVIKAVVTPNLASS